ncbi:hypothetical protein NC652_020023 [Populus alba x Populus x berolinensis]|nr:hypothetical protein NC652_020023 [Populus alba x Populus x berolinensis]
MKIPTLFKIKETKQTMAKMAFMQSTPRLFLSGVGEDVIKTVNSVFFDPSERVETPESWFTNSSETTSFSTESEGFDGSRWRYVVREVRSERLFFEPGETKLGY